MSLLKVPKPILYSTVTTLALNINEQYYGNTHYMWCTPYFGSDYTSPTFTVPPSSSPVAIYSALKSEIRGRDLHGTLIKIKRLGIRRGADAMQKRGKISLDEAREIKAVCARATPEDFMPVLCLIPRVDAIPFVQPINVRAKAHPLSQEYVIADVPASAFDFIKIG